VAFLALFCLEIEAVSLQITSIRDRSIPQIYLPFCLFLFYFQLYADSNSSFDVSGIGSSMIDPTYKLTVVGILPQFWLLAIVSGILQYALAFLLYLIALQTIPVSHAAFYVALIPVFGVASAIILIGEQPSSAQWIGAVLVIASSYCANRLQTS
jgi:drug/metabolite transporter (DMT)-like permease